MVDECQASGKLCLCPLEEGRDLVRLEVDKDALGHQDGGGGKVDPGALQELLFQQFQPGEVTANHVVVFSVEVTAACMTSVLSSGFFFQHFICEH